MQKLFLLLGLCIYTITGFSQIREVPSIVTESFKEQYPDVEEYEVKDMMVKVVFYFKKDNENMTATYNNKGIWKGTEKEWEYDKLPSSVKDGFDKSMYADRKVEETAILYLPGDAEQYRLKVKRNDFEKKYIYFNKSGRLLRESITL